MEVEEVEYMNYTLALGRSQQTLQEMIGSDRVDKFFAGPNAAIEKAYFDGIDQADLLLAKGQITDDEWEARHQRMDEEYESQR